jgi:hypothetical protein
MGLREWWEKLIGRRQDDGGERGYRASIDSAHNSSTLPSDVDASEASADDGDDTERSG